MFPIKKIRKQPVPRERATGGRGNGDSLQIGKLKREKTAASDRFMHRLVKETFSYVCV